MKNIEYNYYVWPNSRNFCLFYEFGVEEHDGDVTFFNESEHKAPLAHAHRIICNIALTYGRNA